MGVVIFMLILFAFGVGLFFQEKETVENSNNELREQKEDSQQEIDSISEDYKLTATKDDKPAINLDIIMNHQDLERLKSEYPNINFFIDEVEKDPYYDEYIEFNRYTIEDIEKLFKIYVDVVGSTEDFMKVIETYLTDNYISENSLPFLRLYIKAIVLQGVAYGETEYLWKLIKAFICIYENAKRQSVQNIVNEINQAYASTIEFIQLALKNPIVPGMKNPEEILETAEVLLNLYCLFPTTIIEDYLEELVDILEYQRFTSISQKKANEIIVFYKKINCLLFNNGFTNIDKLFKTYSERTPKLDAVTVNYFDEKKGTCVISIDFIETPNCNVSFLISALDDEKKIIPFDTYANDLHYNFPYVSNSSIECGYVGIKGTIFAFPKQAKFIQVSMNSQKIIHEFNLKNTEGKDLLIKKLLEGMELNS